jgi:hypothetical protein
LEKTKTHKKMRLSWSLFSVLLWLSSFGVSGCAVNKVGPDLVDYVNQGILNISQLEAKAFESYASVTGTNYTTDEAVYIALKDEVIPTYERYLHLLKNIDVQTEDVKNLHLIYIQGAEMIDRGFRSKMSGIENKDESLIIRGNEEIEKGYAVTEKWRSKLTDLYKIHGVNQEDKKKMLW